MLNLSDDDRRSIEKQFEACKEAGKSAWSAVHEFELETSILIFDVLVTADGYLARLTKPDVFSYQTEMEQTFEISVAASANKFLKDAGTVINKVLEKLKKDEKLKQS